MCCYKRCIVVEYSTVYYGTTDQYSVAGNGNGSLPSTYCIPGEQQQVQYVNGRGGSIDITEIQFQPAAF